ncbi:chromosome replication/partitioning protein [Borreliella burgdorferi]|uniref:chromosome replication/partitioning protein n=2 Tax=Borreliella burgdorferi TaxID=139 RepID=UPI00016C39FF|nr:chromosome replication/partitioning protein [Borreliella burgdorferi]ACN55768.1 putative plasmid partition protein [Borreliella burgdorferi WI91-23]ACN92510.1 putative plasmid partition protein [Borreliella burgdorferi 94a]MCD2371564.1 chromosome replication/partitioning protein [Borreliella burgdorferi]MCD2375360.1 chromosome replication/partitioning protein [Borreliella burgdorferi]MCD2417189.1 chromosome replication/partitioning protein [Borreliella burgdorferi]
MEKKRVKRILTKKIDTYVEQNLMINESKISYYKTLKEKLNDNFKKEILHRVENIKILKEIKDNQYYKFDGYKTFLDFIKDFNVAKTQAYKYLRLATALQEGLIKEDYLIENGIKNSYNFIKDKESPALKKSRQNPIKPLRFQLKTQESYDYYKKNAKFTAFILEELLKNQKDFLKKLLKKYEELKI